MAQTTIVCDQAIFTSIRGPMGEGYRIVAASRGLRPEEKQAITRRSPSHEALCLASDRAAPGTDAAGAAFYPLPTGRLCVAFTCLAGAEHTGRGGQRVFTHNCVFSEADFARCGCNPFAVLRAMKSAGLAEPQLTPDPVLSSVEMAVDANSAPLLDERLRTILPTIRRRFVTRCLLEGKAVAVELAERWTEWTEAIVLGLPGPLRARVSFGAGLRFSMGRGHCLQVFHDNKQSAARRAPAQGICFVDCRTSGDAPDSAWLSFVDFHWSSGDTGGLVRRTSRPFTDCSPGALERIGRLYNASDALPQTPSTQVLSLVTRTLAELGHSVEREIRVELCDAAGRTMLDRLSRARWDEVRSLWDSMLSLWRCGGDATAFASPLIACAMRSAAAHDPLSTAEAALDLLRGVPAVVDRKLHDALLDEILNRLAAAAPQMPDKSLARLTDVVRRWLSGRPGCPIVATLAERCAAVQTSGARP